MSKPGKVLRLIATVKVGDHQTEDEVRELADRMNKMLGDRIEFLDPDDVVVVYRPVVESDGIRWTGRELPPDSMSTGEKLTTPEEAGDTYYYLTGPVLSAKEREMREGK